MYSKLIPNSSYLWFDFCAAVLKLWCDKIIRKRYWEVVFMFLSSVRKSFSGVLCALLLCTLIPVGGADVAKAATEFTVNVSPVSGNFGEQIVVPVNFVNVPADGVSTADMTIEYDATKLEYVSGAAGSIVTNAGTNFAMNKVSNGVLKALFLDYTMDAGYISQNGAFTNLTFKVLSSAGDTTSISLTSATFGDKNLKTIASTKNSATITLNGGAAPTPVKTAGPVKTAASNGFEVDVSSVAGNVGEQIAVPINFASIPANGISTAGMTIIYDAAKLEYVSGVSGSIIENPTTDFAINKVEDGKLKVLFLDYTMSTGHIKTNGVFANLKFKVLSSAAGITSISLTDTSFGDKDLVTVVPTINSSTITLNGGVAATPTIAPTATPTIAPTATPTIAPTATPVRTTTPSEFAVYVDSASGNAGEQIVVPVKFENIPAGGVSTADMTITYDATKLEYVSGAAGSIVTDPGTNFAINKVSNGLIKVLFLDYTMEAGYISTNGVFANLTFKVLSSAAVSTKVDITAATFGDKDLSTLSATNNSGIIALNGGGALEPVITPTPTITVTATPVITTAPSGYTVYVGSVSGKAGEQIVVPVNFENVPASGISTADMTITYDATKLEYVSGAAGSIVTNPSTNFGINKVSNGLIKVLFLDYTMETGPISTNGVFANLTFKVLGSGSASTKVDITAATFGDKALNTISTKLSSGTITINGGAEVTPVPTSTPIVTQNPTTSGNYTVSYSQNSWGAGATVSLIITNNSSSAINGWTVNFSYSGNQKITNAWNCSFTQSGNSVTLTNADYNASIPAGGSVTAGFNITYSGTNDAPTNFTVRPISEGPSTPTQTPPPEQSQPSAGNCAVSYSQNSWGTGATVNLTIKNNGSQAVNGWTVNYTYAGNQKIANSWNCSYTQSGNSVTLTNASYNATIPAGGSVTVGFNISYSGTNTEPTNFTVK